MVPESKHKAKKRGITVICPEMPSKTRTPKDLLALATWRALVNFNSMG